MKKFNRNFSIFGLICLLALFLIAGCKSKDTVSPNLYLNGDVTMKISLNSNYTELGATANDNKDGDITNRIEITNPLDTMESDGQFQDIWLPRGATIQVGTYTITYTVKDDAGNTTTLTRTVTVENDVYRYGNDNLVYEVTKEDLTPPILTYLDYETQLESDENINNRLWFPKFSNLEFYTLKVYANIREDSIFIPLQTFPSDNNYVFQGEQVDKGGFAGFLDRTHYKFEIKYNASSNSTSNEIYDENYSKKL